MEYRIWDADEQKHHIPHDLLDLAVFLALKQSGRKLIFQRKLFDSPASIYEGDIVAYSISDTQHSVGEVIWDAKACRYFFDGAYNQNIDLTYIPRVVGHKFDPVFGQAPAWIEEVTRLLFQANQPQTVDEEKQLRMWAEHMARPSKGFIQAGTTPLEAVTRFSSQHV